MINSPAPGAAPLVTYGVELRLRTEGREAELSALAERMAGLWLIELRQLGLEPVDQPLIIDPVYPLDPLATCGCSGPEGWHCEGEESQHWCKDDETGECGHCGWAPDPEGVASAG